VVGGASLRGVGGEGEANEEDELDVRRMVAAPPVLTTAVAADGEIADK
jgi:hypothetical protein